MRIKILKNEKHNRMLISSMKINYRNFVEKDHQIYAYDAGYVENFSDYFPYNEIKIFKYFNRLELGVYHDLIVVQHFTSWECFNTLQEALDYIEKPPLFTKIKAFIDLMISRITKE